MTDAITLPIEKKPVEELSRANFEDILKVWKEHQVLPIKHIPALLAHPKPAKRIVDPGHLSRIRELPCLTCGVQGVTVAHHILRNVNHGTGLKSGDNFTVPLCSVCHNKLHMNGNETKFFSEFNIYDPKGLADLLYKHSKDHDMCLELVGRFPK